MLLQYVKELCLVKVTSLVENIGVEPMTSWMQIKRSSQLS